MNRKIEREDLEEYLEARESQLNNVLSSPIGTGDYSMPSTEEIDDTIFLEDEIENTKSLLDLFDDEDEVMMKFLGILKK
ncbi:MULTISPECIES: hypothetical protein [Bacteroidales]|mgnify:FL=1|uniref:hypothetical protein n=1 Tax=Bacteroidales TaxID=171549 RepID=UPI0025B79C1C|nr:MULTISPECIES: hypothetical protein [Bacteroidales]